MRKATAPPLPRADSSRDPILNGVQLPDGSTVAWAVAFPRP